MKKLSGLIPGATVAQWHEYMQLLAGPLDHTVRNPQYVSRIWTAIGEARPPLSPAAGDCSSCMPICLFWTNCCSLHWPERAAPVWAIR